MNSFLNLLVRVRTDRAVPNLQRVQNEVNQVNAAVARGNAMQPMGRRHISSMMKFGNQLQWTGRMLQYNFTMPLLAAGGAATYFALEQDKAFVHVSKVYGDTTEAAAQFRKEMGLGREAAMQLAESYKTEELEALDQAFTAISNHYGVQKKEVLEVAGAWAAAGSSGRDLAESVNQTMQAIIIGDMKAGEATKALISIQAQYNLSTQELQATLANLNSVENQTGASMADLITGFEKAAGVARSAGVETQQLAAYMAALVPATGSASTAGQALKTIFSRLMGPTKEATQVMEEMGIAVSGQEWQSATVNERLQIMAEKYDGMGAAAKNAASAVIASRWQINKFDVLMREMINTNGFYQKALKSTENQGESFTRMQEELNTVLESDPRKLQRMFVILQNASVEIIQPLIPHIIYLAQVVADLATKFAGLDPVLQKFVLFGLVALAAIGPLVRYVGALSTLFGVFGVAFGAVARGLGIVNPGMKTMSDGSERARRSLLGLLKMMLLMPFTALASGFFGMASMISNAFGLAARSSRHMADDTVRAQAAARSRVTRIWGAAGLGSVFSSLWASIVGISAAGGASVVSTSAASGASLVATVATSGASATAATAASETARTSAVVAGGLARINAEVASMGTRNATVAAMGASLVTTEQTVSSAQARVRQAFYVYMTNLLNAYWAAHRGIHSSGYTSLFAIESAYYTTSRARAAGELGGRLALEASAQSRMTAIGASGAVARMGTEAAAGATYTATHVGTWSNIAAITAAGSATTTGIVAKGNAAKIGLFTHMGKWIRDIVAVTAARLAPLFAAMFGPWGIAIMAAIGVLYYFRDEIGQVFSNVRDMMGGSVSGIGDLFGRLRNVILDAFYSLPQGVQSAMQAVVDIVRSAALAVYDWFSYINPWARHSPSLVENVNTGITAVMEGFGRLRKVGNPIKAAYAEIKRFGKLTAGLGVSASNIDQRSDRKTLAKAGAGKALASYNRLQKMLDKLSPTLGRVEGRMKAQERVVGRWEARVGVANRRLDKQQGILDRLQKRLDKYTDKVNEAQESLDYFSNAPLKGMREMETQIFRNQMAQTKLRLEMMNMEDAYGTFDEIKNKIEMINGAQELLRGDQANLRSAGAGSEILKNYDNEIKKLDKQRDSYTETANKLGAMSTELDKLQRQAEKLDLVKAMKFDELQFNIAMAADRMKELSYEEIMQGITKANNQLDRWTPLMDQATAAVERQQLVVDRLTTARDRIQDRLDAEQNSLDRIQERYDTISQTIQDIGSALDDVVSKADAINQARDAAKEAAKAKKDKGLDKGAAGKGPKAGGSDEYVSPGLANFRAAGNADFADPGGLGIPPRTDWKSQADDIKKFTDQLAQDTASMFGSINPFSAIKDKALQFWGWIKERASDAGDWIGGVFGKAFDGVGGDNKLSKVFDGLKGAGQWVTGELKAILGYIKTGVDLIWPPLKRVGKELWKSLVQIWNEVGPELAKFSELFRPIIDAFKEVWSVVKPVVAILGGALFAGLIASLYGLKEVVGPVLRDVGDVIVGVIRFVRGFVRTFIALVNGDWSQVWTGLKEMASGGLKAIWNVISGALNLIASPFKAAFKMIWDAAKWLWDELVGHSIIPDIINGIIFWFNKLKDLGKWVWDNVLKPIFGFFVAAWENIRTGLSVWWSGVQIAWAGLKTAGQWIWDNVLSPIGGFFVSVWNVVKGLVGLWWEGIKIQWAALKGAATWLWTNVLQPIWTKFKEVWDAYILPFLQTWWEGVKTSWAAMKATGEWLWTNVLKPVWDKVKAAWDEYVKPALAAWWPNIKQTWNTLKAVAEWLWTNVLKPVWDKVKDLWDRTREQLAQWRERIVNTWNALKNLGEWIWNNVLNPIFQKVKDLWERAREQLSQWRERIVNTWNNLKNLMDWVWNNVLQPIIQKVRDLWDRVREQLTTWREKFTTAWNNLTTLKDWFLNQVLNPIFQKVKDVWGSIRDWLANNKEMLLGPMKNLANGIRVPINFVIGGLNRVSDMLPGVDFHISPIDKFAAGGMPSRRANAGFKTNGARAIVGEGKANYPEFVIPTDPTYRNRAIGLMMQAQSKLGMFPGGDMGDIKKAQRSASMNQKIDPVSGLPMYDIGGWLGDKWGKIKGELGKQLAKLKENAVNSIMNPIMGPVRGQIRDAANGYAPMSSPPLWSMDKIQDWVTLTNRETNEARKEAKESQGIGGPAIQRALAFARSQQGKPYGWTGVGPSSYDCSGFMSAITNVVRGQSPHSRVGATSSFPWAGFKPGVAPAGFTIGSSPSYSNGVGHMAGTLGGINVESRSGDGVVVGSSARGWNDPGFYEVAHLAKGGIAKARRGGILANIGEGGYDEAVVPLPRDWRGSLTNKTESGNTYNFYGDLSFPNITSGDDAQAFLDNLDSLAKD